MMSEGTTATSLRVVDGGGGGLHGSRVSGRGKSRVK